MTLEITLRKPFNLPRVFWSRNDEPQQDYHWVGHKSDAGQGQTESGNQNKEPKNKKNKQGYRPLSSLTLGEVEDVYTRFGPQLLSAQENWIGKNYFCQIPLKRKRDGRPPMVFGRVKTCYPSDGVVDNVEELELHLPKLDGAPDAIHIHGDDISRNSQGQVQSYFIRTRVMTSAEEKAELVESESMLGVNGFCPEFESGYFDILDLNAGNQSTYPWMYGIGSRWFDTIPDSLREEVKGKLKEMIGWGKQIFNYHPEWLSNDISTLNRVLRYKYGFTPIVLTEPGSAQEIASIVTNTFDRFIFHVS